MIEVSELLGEAILETDVDLGPLDRKLAEAERRVALATARMQQLLDRDLSGVGQRFGQIGGGIERGMTPPVERFGSVFARMASQVEGSSAQIRIEQAAVAREQERLASVAGVTSRVQVQAAGDAADAYREEASAAREAVDAARAHGEAVRSTASTPVPVPTQADRGVEGPSVPVSTSSGSSGGFHFVPLPWWLGGGLRRGGGGRGGGGGTGHNLVFGRGGGFVAGTAAAGSLGSFAGLGAEHLLTTALGLAGSAAGGAIGGGLLGLGTAGQMAVGGGADLAVMRSTIADTKLLQEGYDKVTKAVALYGAGSKQAVKAQHELNLQMQELGGGAGVKAELALAKAAEKLNEFWNKQTSNARVQAVGILTQVLNLGHSYVPLVARAAEENLSILNTGLKPLFAWLKGPQGVGIFHDLENQFRERLPTAVHAGTQALEFFLRLTDQAARFTGGLSHMLDHLFTRLNSMDNVQISQFIGKFVADFRMWSALIKVVGQDIYLLFHQSAGQAGAIVTGLTHALEKLREWERSAKGSAQIRTIFEVHKEQLEALGHALIPFLTAFGHAYLTVAPALTQLTTIALRAFTPIIEALSDLASHSKAAGILIAALLISLQGFGAAKTWQGIKTVAGWLGIAAGAANADAAATARAAAANTALADSASAAAGAEAGLAGAEGAAGGGGVAAGAGGIAGGLAAKGGILGRLARPGAALAETGTAAGALGMGGAEGLLGGAGAVLGVGLPAVAAGGAGFLGGNLVSNAAGVHGAGKGAIEGVAAGAATGAVVGSVVPVLGTAVGALAGAAIGGTAGALAGLLGEKRTVEIKHFNDALHSTPGHIQKLLDTLKGAGSVKTDGVEQPIKQVRDQLEKAKAAQEQWSQTWSKSWRAIHSFATGSGPILRELYERFNANMKLIAHTMGTNSATGRKLVEENVGAMVEHTLGALHKHEIGTRSAMAVISSTISQYTRASGDETPRIYEAMFTKIGGMYRNHEIGSRTAFTAFRTIAARETDHMKGEIEARYRTMFEHLKVEYNNGEITTAQYNRKVKELSHDTAAVVGPSMEKLTESIVNAINAGTLTSAEGSQILHNNLNALLKQFGAKPLPMPQVVKEVKAMSFVKSHMTASGQMHGGAAGGGMFQIGAPGDRGRDAIPMNIGGQEVVVGSGEVAAVFNRHQLPIVDAALAPMGGLEGLFQQVRTPHYMAEGGLVPRMVAKANEITSHHFPYVWGGGHGSFNGPYDCSGAVSAVLHAAGLLGRPETSGELMGFGAPGPGAVTIYANPAHTFMSINGRFFGTHGSSGAEWYGGSALPGFAVRHAPLSAGEATGAFGSVNEPKVGGKGTIAELVQAGLHKATGAANAYLNAHAVGAIAPGVSGAHGGFSRPQLEALWRAANPDLAGRAHLMAAIALAESAGNPQNRNPSGASGLWQILGLPFGGNPFDPMTNARMAGAKLREQGLGAWVTYTSGAYRQFMAAGGVLRELARGGAVFAQQGHHAPPRPPGVRHVKRPTRAPKVSLSHLITELKDIPGMGHILAELGPAEGTYNLLGDEETLLSGMTSNAASILPADMPYLAPTLLPDEHIVPGMLVPQAERVTQRALQAHGESPGLTLQGSLLQWMGGLDDHRLLSGPDVGVLARDFHSTAGGQSISGLPLPAGYPIFKAQESVLRAQLNWQVLLVRIMRHEKDKAVEFIERRKRRRAIVEKLLLAAFTRYRHIKQRVEQFTAARLRRRLSHAELTHAHAEQVHDASEHRAALREAIANERTLPKTEQNEALIKAWNAEEARVAGYITRLGPPPSAAVSSAHEAIFANELKNELHPVEQSLQFLGGSATKIGTSGELGQINKQIATLSAGRDELSTKITDGERTIIPQLQLSIAGIAQSLQEAAESVAPILQATATSEKPAESELATALKARNEQLALELAVSQRQYQVLSQLPPFGGHFAEGGVVPGPTGAPRTAIVHGGEVVSKGGPNIELVVLDGAVDSSRIRVIANGEAVKVTRKYAVGANRPLPSRGGGG